MKVYWKMVAVCLVTGMLFILWAAFDLKTGKTLWPHDPEADPQRNHETDDFVIRFDGKSEWFFTRSAKPFHFWEMVIGKFAVGTMSLLLIWIHFSCVRRENRLAAATNSGGYPDTDSNYTCPHCSEECSISKALTNQNVLCPHCSEEFFATPLENSAETGESDKPPLTDLVKGISELNSTWQQIQAHLPGRTAQRLLSLPIALLIGALTKEPVPGEKGIPLVLCVIILGFHVIAIWFPEGMAKFMNRSDDDDRRVVFSPESTLAMSWFGLFVFPAIFYYWS